MNTNKALQDIFKMQDSANKVMGGENWVNKGYTWKACSAVEIGEMIDHLGYKHWKNQVSKWEQAFVECVDVLHFFASDVIVENKINRGKDLEDAVGQIANAVDLAIHNGQVDKIVEQDKGKAIDEATTLISKVVQYGKGSEAEEITIQLIKTCNAMGYTTKDLLEGYIGKVTLNMFRQKNGDREGTYPRNWETEFGTEEDNEVMRRIIKKSPEVGLDRDMLTKALEEEFKKKKN